MEEKQIKHYYINRTEISGTNYDFTFRFKLEIPDGAKATAEKLEELVISTSPQHGKAMFLALKRQVEVFEDKFGPLPEPPTQEKQDISDDQL